MKKIILLIGMGLAFSLSFQSCSTSIDGVIESGDTTVEEDKQNIQGTVDKFYNKLNNLSSIVNLE